LAKKILAVDDSMTMRKMVGMTLTRGGFDVTEAFDGIDALEKASMETFDLVLADVNMPRMDGLTMIAKLREIESYKTKPILVLTTESGHDMREKGKSGRGQWLDCQAVFPRKTA
jgi:two-component system chemotaxis response regulator CheY